MEVLSPGGFNLIRQVEWYEADDTKSPGLQAGRGVNSLASYNDYPSQKQ